MGKHDDNDVEVVEALRRQLRVTFDDVATLYDEVRPGYPAAMYDDIYALTGIADGGSILEIGCGTGQATLPLAQRGYRIRCIELGAELAAIARRNLAAYPQVEVCVGAFETEPLAEDSFDLAVSATAFHWIDPAAYPKLARALRPNGAVALFWNEHVTSAVDGGFFDRVKRVYRQYAPELTENWNNVPTSDEPPDRSTGLTATGLFGDVAVRRYPWVARYDAAGYLRLINTYSNHLMIPADRRQRLNDGIAAMIEGEYGGQITKQYLTVLYVAHRRSS